MTGLCYSNLPRKGWECVDMEDLGEPDEICQWCDRQEIRYVHIMAHAEVEGTTRVGCVCAEKHMGDEYARPREGQFKRELRQRKREEERRERGQQRRDRMSAHVEMTPSQRDRIVQAIRELVATDQISTKEREFLGGLEYRFSHMGWWLTERQYSWLCDIYQRVTAVPTRKACGFSLANKHLMNECHRLLAQKPRERDAKLIDEAMRMMLAERGKAPPKLILDGLAAIRKRLENQKKENAA
jgi:hypothetical protein